MSLGRPLGFGILIARTAGFVLRVKVSIGRRSLGRGMPKTKSILTLLGGSSQSLSDWGIRKPWEIRKVIDDLTGTLLHFGVNIRVGSWLHTFKTREACQRQE